MKREIREFRPEDAGNVARMWNESDSAWPGGFTQGVPFTAERVLRDQARRRFLATFIAFADGKAVGYCSLMQFWQDPRAAYVALLGAHPAYHGLGFGRDLLKAAVARTVELGYDRLDLHTWAGNLKAVPLYKKTGFFWVPETSVHMENYLPTILNLSCARDFFEGADWYTCFRRDLSVRPDEWVEEGMKVFPYEFEREGRRLRVLVDRQARGVTAVETEAFALSCRSGGQKAPVGVPAPVRWEVRNRRPEHGPLRVALLARADEGLQLGLQKTIAVDDVEAIEAGVTPSPDVRERHPDDAAQRVHTTAVLGDQVVELKTGLRVCQPVKLSAPDHCVYLTPGTPKTISLLLRSNLEAPARVSLRLAGPAQLRLEPAVFELDLLAGTCAGVTTSAMATAEGSYVLTGHLTLEGGGVVAQPGPQSVPVHCVGIGGVVGSFDERRALLTSAQLRVVVSRRGARFEVFDAGSGRQLGGSSSALGPPFGPTDLDNRDFDVHFEQRPGSLTAVLTAQPSAYPGLIYQRRVELASGPDVRLVDRVINGSDTARTLQVSVTAQSNVDPARLAVPLAEGLVVEQAVSYPDWRDPELGKPAQFRENWIAADGAGLVAGWVWERASTIEPGGWGRLHLVLDLGEVGPSQAMDCPTLWFYGGAGDWEAVRRFWRANLAPDASEQAPPPRRALDVELGPPVLVGDGAQLEMRSFRSRALSGQAWLEFPSGPTLNPASFEVDGWARGNPLSRELRVEWPDGAQRGAWAGRLRVDTEVWKLEFPLVVVRGGDGRAAVKVGEEQREGRAVVVVDNGWLAFAVAPDFAGALVELRDDRADHLLCAFPKERPFLFLNPWFGGITPQAQPAQAWLGAQPMAAHAYTCEEVERDGLFGQRWRGVALSAEPQHSDLRGLTLRVQYLTLGRSNLLTVITRLETAGAPVRVRHGALFFPAPGGSADNLVTHFERGGRWAHRRVGECHTLGEGWIAAENPATGDVLALVAGTRTAQLLLIDEGRDLVAFAAANQPPTSESGPVEEMVSCLVVARSLEQASLYRALAQRANDGLR